MLETRKRNAAAKKKASDGISIPLSSITAPLPSPKVAGKPGPKKASDPRVDLARELVALIHVIIK